MTEATIEDAQKALRGALQDIEDPEVKYKIRTALQFCEVVKYQEDKLLSIIEEDTTTDNSEVFDRLRELGYLE